MNHLRFAFLLFLGACLSAAGCKPKVDVMGQAVKETPAGKPCPDEIGLISDGESNKNQINPIQNRGGYWYTFVDKTGSTVTPTQGEAGGTFTMREGGANGTKYAACMKGSIGGADIVYAGMGLNFVDPKGQYDASKFGGISFWARKVGGTTGHIRLKVPDVNTDPDGKVCSECFNDFGMDLTVGPNWQQFTIPFTSMKQLKGWGSPLTGGIEPSTLYGMQWQVNDKGSQYDICVDEIRFTGCQ